MGVIAHETYVRLNPNGANVNGVAAIGHIDPSGGGAINSYGQAFAGAGHQWTTDLCNADSDGDGQFNGWELGDPCCTWVEGATPLFLNDISNPGDDKSTTSRPEYNCSAQPSPSAAATPSVTPTNNDAVTIGASVGAAGGGLLVGAFAMYLLMKGRSGAAKAGKKGKSDGVEHDYEHMPHMDHHDDA